MVSVHCQIDQNVQAIRLATIKSSWYIYSQISSLEHVELGLNVYTATIQLKVLCHISATTQKLNVREAAAIFIQIHTFILSTLHRNFHHVNIFTRSNSLVIEIQALLNLFSQFFSKDGSAPFCNATGGIEILKGETRSEIERETCQKGYKVPAKQSMRDAIEHLFAR